MALVWSKVLIWVYLVDKHCRSCSAGFIRIYLYWIFNRGYYMSAHVLLNLLNELRNRDEMQGLSSILSLFCNEFNKSNNTGA